MKRLTHGEVKMLELYNKAHKGRRLSKSETEAMTRWITNQVMRKLK